MAAGSPGLLPLIRAARRFVIPGLSALKTRGAARVNSFVVSGEPNIVGGGW